jgi:hypothetical protein
MRIADYLPGLPATIATTMLEELRAALPLPVPDTPENRAARDHAALIAVAVLHPTNAADLILARSIVAMHAHAADCLRQADTLRHDPRMADRLRTLGNRMTRESLATTALLRTCQADAAKRAARQPPSPPPRILAPLPRDAADAREQRAARIRALDLRLIETPPTMH